MPAIACDLPEELKKQQIVDCNVSNVIAACRIIVLFGNLFVAEDWAAFVTQILKDVEIFACNTHFKDVEIFACNTHFKDVEIFACNTYFKDVEIFACSTH